MLEAKPGKGGDLEAFPRAGRELAVAEEGTVTWYAFKIGDTSYGIFDTFAIDDARTAAAVQGGLYGKFTSMTSVPSASARSARLAVSRA